MSAQSQAAYTASNCSLPNPLLCQRKPPRLALVSPWEQWVSFHVVCDAAFAILRTSIVTVAGVQRINLTHSRSNPQTYILFKASCAYLLCADALNHVFASRSFFWPGTRFSIEPAVRCFSSKGPCYSGCVYWWFWEGICETSQCWFPFFSSPRLVITVYHPGNVPTLGTILWRLCKSLPQIPNRGGRKTTQVDVHHWLLLSWRERG